MTPSRAVLASLAACSAVVLALACAELRRGFGEDCLKNDDCLSNICSSQKCSSSPTLLPPGVNGNGGGDGAADASNDGPATTEGGPGPDADVGDTGVADTNVADTSDAPTD